MVVQRIRVRYEDVGRSIKDVVAGDTGVSHTMSTGLATLHSHVFAIHHL